jgi:transposase-like protein
MDKGITTPKSLQEAIKFFADPDNAHRFMVGIRWPDGHVCCPSCGSLRVRYIQTRRQWECREQHPKRRFSLKTGTIMEESPLPLEKWLAALWLEVNCKNSISSYEIARDLGVTQKTGWFMLHRIRFALHQGSFDMPMQGIIEADETFVGGLAKNMHKKQRERKITGTGGSNKTAVMGLLARHDGKKHSTVRAKVMPDLRHEAVRTVVNQNVAQGATVYTDAFQAYRTMGPEYFHDFVDHTEAYVKGAVHTNGLENFWALFKRCIKGTHVSVEPFHLGAYVDAEAYRFNNRENTDAGRFFGAVKSAPGKRLMYKTLIGDTSLEGLAANGNEEENDELQN